MVKIYQYLIMIKIIITPNETYCIFNFTGIVQRRIAKCLVLQDCGSCVNSRSGASISLRVTAYWLGDAENKILVLFSPINKVHQVYI